MLRQSRLRSDNPPHLVLCAGLKSSGSTWLYNAVIQILEHAGRHGRDSNSGPAVLPFYAENLRAFPPGAEKARFVVVKTHIPSDSLRFLTRFVHGVAFITVREPRDAIASLMQRFHHKFPSCLRGIAVGATRMVQLSKAGEFNLLRYEDRFFDRQDSIHEIAVSLGIRLPAKAAGEIFHSLTRDQVKLKIDSMRQEGVFGKNANPNRFDPKTHWHPGHVGDAKIGKYAEALSRKEQRAVLAATADYCEAFGYNSRFES